jgi:hypothetical protein
MRVAFPFDLSFAAQTINTYASYSDGCSIQTIVKKLTPRALLSEIA